MGLLSIRSILKNEENGVAQKGIENLLPPELFEDRFYTSREVPGDYGANNTIRIFDKTGFCRYVCEERRQAGDFENHRSIVEILEGFLVS